MDTQVEPRREIGRRVAQVSLKLCISSLAAVQEKSNDLVQATKIGGLAKQ
jgi:hypothetical protein